tara:strand:+ start:123 stop:395 length:273 start_codon:yes stop_codon:yes gene_type:complete
MKDAKNIIKNQIKDLVEDQNLKLSDETPLIGDGSPLDSMNIVNLCLRLEDIAESKGFSFDWSGETMSKSKSMFKSISDLADELSRQQKSK